jgi:hypothetical protein
MSSSGLSANLGAGFLPLISAALTSKHVAPIDFPFSLIIAFLALKKYIFLIK